MADDNLPPIEMLVPRDEREPAEEHTVPLPPEAPRALTNEDRRRELDDAQQSFTENLADGFDMTAISGAGRVISDEAQGVLEDRYGPEGPQGMEVIDALSVSTLTLFGLRGGEKDYDKAKHYDALTRGIPIEYHDDILENDQLDAAYRARARVQEDLRRMRRVAQQDGKVAILAGSLADADLPLMFMTGGGYGGAKAAQIGARIGQLSGTGRVGARVGAGVVQGASGGLQAGAIVGGVDAASRETVGWQDMAAMMTTSTILGAGLGGVLGAEVRQSARLAQEDFNRRVAEDAPEFREPIDVDALENDNIIDFMPQSPNPADAQSINASAVPQAVQAGQYARALPDTTPTNQDWISAAARWRDESGWQRQKEEDLDSTWGKIATSQAMNLTTNNFKRLYMSESAVANYVAGTIFESASGIGRGRATAAMRMANYHGRIQTNLTDVNFLALQWARENDMTWQKSGFGIGQDGTAVFNREVMLELNDRAMGRSSSRNPHVKKAADQYEKAGQESLNIARGRDGEQPIDGFENVQDRRGYTPYRWDGSKIAKLERAGVVKRDAIVHALAKGYRDAGMAAGKDAEAVAKAVVHRALAKDAEMDMSIVSLLTADGKDFIHQSMLNAGMTRADADALIDRLQGAQHNRQKESFAKTRNEIDMNTRVVTNDGSELRIVDIMDNDLHGTWQRYTRQVSGSAALARHGVTNRAKRREIIDAMRAEQRALGEEVMDAELLEAMFSHFNAGAIHGYGLRGGTNEGIGEAALVKRITNLSLLEKLGVTQIAETGVIIAQNGLANWMQRGPMALLDQEIKRGNQQVLDELAWVTGEIGKEHWHYAQWLDLDDVSPGDRGAFLQTANKWASNASFVQAYTSAFNHVRAFQQKTAALGVTDKVFRDLKTGLDDMTRGRFQNDLGLGDDDIAALSRLIDDGTIEFGQRGNHTFVNKLNMDQWDAETLENFGSAVTRNVNQLVQKSMAGEQDAWMHTVVGSLFTHLKTFPLQAMSKQIMRNAKHLDQQAFATVLFGLATAAVAVMIRGAIDGREQDIGDIAKGAFNYSNMTGVIPFAYDPLMTILGMDNARINQYGPTYDIVPPSVNIANDLMRVPGAVLNTVQGDAEWHDQQALKAIPFAGTYFLSRLFDNHSGQEEGADHGSYIRSLLSPLAPGEAEVR